MKSNVESHRTKRMKMSTLVEDMDDTTNVSYRPKTPETKQIYDTLLNLVQAALGDCTREIYYVAADEVLMVLKSDKVRERDKKKDVEELLGKIADERYALLVNLCKKITDWASDDNYHAGLLFSDRVVFNNNYYSICNIQFGL